VDREKVTVDRPEITGAEILALVKKTPALFKLYEHRRHHQPKLIQPEEIVHLHAHQIERFTTMPKDTTEGLGSAALSRVFELPEADRQYLNRLGLKWECFREGETHWAIVHAWQTPEGYNRLEVDLALLVPPLYPDAQIDMVYFKPHLGRLDGKAIPNLSDCVIQGEKWQCWSRHRTQQKSLVYGGRRRGESSCTGR
jgi:Prokaryotic E2 family E/Multiubiquitin